MKYDQYGRPIHNPHDQYSIEGHHGAQGYGAPPQHPTGTLIPQGAPTAKLSMPSMGQLGGQNETPWIRFPFYPTAPFTSTNPYVGSQTRYYGATVLSTDADYQIGTELIRTVQFDIPCRLIAVNGFAINNAAPGGALANASTNLDGGYLFRMEYTTGDKLNTAARLAATCLGTMENPGELGGTGYTIDQGATLVLGITPLTNLTGLTVRIDITLVCLEIRGNRNFNMP